jgi:hypothetical protein
MRKGPGISKQRKPNLSLLWREWKEMKVYIIDLAAWGLVGIAAALGAYACWLFETHVSATIAKGIVRMFYHGS